MPKPWELFNPSEHPLLVSMVYYVHSVILISQHFNLSYFSTSFISFTSVPLCFFILSNCGLQLEKSFHNLYWNHFLFVSGVLSSVCDRTDNDVALGKLFFFVGISILSFYSLYVWCCHQRRGSDSSEEHGVMTEISVSLMANGIALIGRWFIPRDNLLWLVIGAATMFSIAVVFFCYYLFSSRKLKKP